MAIEKEVRPLPAKAGWINYSVTQQMNEDGTPGEITATLTFQPVTAQGVEVGQARSVNLLDQISPAKKTSYKSDITAFRAKIDAEAF